MGPVSAPLPGGRLHLQHGPIDLVIGADGDRERAFQAAEARFATVLQELVEELPLLRTPLTPHSSAPGGETARRMHAACLPHAGVFVTPMAAVAGAVAETVLAAMLAAAPLRRAYVNDGGDIALHLGPGQAFSIAIADHTGHALGQVAVTAEDGVGGIATSGRHGRSLSFGITDSVTVLAATAAAADAAATLIGNAVDLPGHPAITRRPASEVRDDSDLGDRLVVTGVGALSPAEKAGALARGLCAAETMREKGLIRTAALFLQGAARVLGGGVAVAMGEPAAG